MKTSHIFLKIILGLSIILGVMFLMQNANSNESLKIGDCVHINSKEYDPWFKSFIFKVSIDRNDLKAYLVQLFKAPQARNRTEMLVIFRYHRVGLTKIPYNQLGMWNKIRCPRVYDARQ